MKYVTLYLCLVAKLVLADTTLEETHVVIDKLAKQNESQTIALRRDFHQHPELSNREFRTSKVIANHLKKLGLEVKTGVAHTGVVGILRGSDAGRVVALRADMDALPVTEATDLPFKSTVRTKYNNRDVGVMHACGHDAHMAILLGAAEILSELKNDLPGTVIFIFQPAEEGPPPGEEGGAPLMVKEGVLRSPKVDAIFGLHVFPYSSGTITVRKRGVMAASDKLLIEVHGKQTHAALPWDGVDPIVVSSQIVLGLQSVVSRQSNLTTAPAIVSVGRIEGGNRGNIIPAKVTMEGTIRTLDPNMRVKIHAAVKRTVEKIAESAGAVADVTITPGVPVTYNDPDLTDRMSASLRRVASDSFVPDMPAVTVAEDFSFFQREVPGMFFFLGVNPKDVKPGTAAPNHSPKFMVDEAALVTGVRAMASLAVDYLHRSDAE